MTIHQNLIAGEWTGTTGAENINPSDTNEVVGLYASANAQDVTDAIAAAKAAFPAWSRSGILERHSILRKTSDEILARKDELGALLAREEGKTLPEAIGETIRAAQIFDFFAGEALRLRARCCPPCGRTSASRSPASRSASSASSRPGISRSPFPPGRSRRRFATAIPSSSSQPIWCPAAPGRSSISSTAPACRRAS